MADPDDPALPPDRQQIERLLERNLDGLRAFLRLRVGAAIRARLGHSDIVQSVCRDLLQSPDRFAFQGETAFRNWLYTAALRKVLQNERRLHAARRDARREVAVDGDAEAAVLQGYADAITPSVIAMGREGAAKLEEAFDELSEDDRAIITQARIVGLSHAEIAAGLGCNEDACRQKLRRAVVRLSIALAKRGITV